MADLVERLRAAHPISAQLIFGSHILAESADEITSLRAALTACEADRIEQARLNEEAYRRGVEDAAKVAIRFGKSPARQHMRKRMGLPWPVVSKPLALQAIRIAAAIRALSTKDGGQPT